jgi:hypothetical protein
MSTFHAIHLFHILRELNGVADKEANKAVLLSKGVLLLDGIEGLDKLP